MHAYHGEPPEHEENNRIGKQCPQVVLEQEGPKDGKEWQKECARSDAGALHDSVACGNVNQRGQTYDE